MKRHVLGLLALLGCDPVMSIQGTVRSQSATGKRTALPGADVTLVCPSLRNLLARSGRDGAFLYATVGWWPKGCHVEVTTVDESHQATMRSVEDLCRESSGDPDCLQISGAEFAVREVKTERETLRLTFRPDREGLELVQRVGTGDEVLCSGRCEVNLLPGPQHLAVRLQQTHHQLWTDRVTLAESQTMDVHFVEDTDPAWVNVIGLATSAVGSALLIYSGLTEHSDIAVVGGGTLVLGLTTMAVWAPGMHNRRDPLGIRRPISPLRESFERTQEGRWGLTNGAVHDPPLLRLLPEEENASARGLRPARRGRHHVGEQLHRAGPR